MRPFASMPVGASLSRSCALARATISTPGSAVACSKSLSRSFSSLPTLRPTILPRSTTIFRSSTPSNSASLALNATDASSFTLDIVPKTAITAHPALGGLQIRCGPRPTMATTSRLVRKRRHGFLSRIRTRTGRRLLQRRKTKGRKILSN